MSHGIVKSCCEGIAANQRNLYHVPLGPPANVAHLRIPTFGHPTPPRWNGLGLELERWNGWAVWFWLFCNGCACDHPGPSLCGTGPSAQVPKAPNQRIWEDHHSGGGEGGNHI